MKSMNNQEFDRKVKAKLDRFDAPVPLGLWDKIEQELDAKEETSLEALLPTLPKPIRSFKQIILICGPIAAMLCIAFSLWKFNDTTVIYLKKHQELARIEPEVKEGIEDEGGRMPLVDVPAKPVRLPITVQEVVSVSAILTEKTAYVNPKSGEAPLSLEPTKPNALGAGSDQTALIESELALAPIEIMVDRKEVLTEANEDLVLASQEAMTDAIEDQYPLYEEEVKSAKNKKIGVSTVLNFLAKGFSGEEGKSIEFSENEEGILQWDIKSSLAKTRQKK